MEPIITKVDDLSANVATTVTVVKNERVTLDDVIADRASLVRTIAANDAENEARNAKIRDAIAQSDAKIEALRAVGLKTRSEIVEAEALSAEPTEEITAA